MKSKAYITLDLGKLSHVDVEIILPNQFLGDYTEKLDELKLEHMVLLEGDYHNCIIESLKFHKGEHGVIVKIKSVVNVDSLPLEKDKKVDPNPSGNMIIQNQPHYGIELPNEKVK